METIDGRNYVANPVVSLTYRGNAAGYMAIWLTTGNSDVRATFKEPVYTDLVAEYEKVVLGTSLLTRPERYWIMREFHGLYTEVK